MMVKTITLVILCVYYTAFNIYCHYLDCNFVSTYVNPIKSVGKKCDILMQRGDSCPGGKGGKKLAKKGRDVCSSEKKTKDS